MKKKIFYKIAFIILFGILYSIAIREGGKIEFVARFVCIGVLILGSIVNYKDINNITKR